MPPDCLLVTLDVSSLYMYTSIPHNEGVDTCREILNTRGVLSPATEDLVQLIPIILMKNTLLSMDRITCKYNVHETALGTHMAPSYANVFMGKLESSLLQKVSMKPDIWWRYIDDVFAIWLHGEQNLTFF